MIPIILSFDLMMKFMRHFPTKPLQVIPIIDVENDKADRNNN